MSEHIKETSENDRIPALVARIKELETALELSGLRTKAAIEMTEKINGHYRTLCQQNQNLLLRIKKLEDPEERYDTAGLGWLSKIALILKRSGRPMRSREIFQELSEMDKASGAMSWLANPEGQISVVLRNGVSSGRLRRFSIRGTRGGYYALEEWMDKDGKLTDEMKRQMV